MVSFEVIDFGSFRRNLLASLLILLAFISGVLVGLGPLSKYSPIMRPVVNWEGVLLSDAVDKMAIDVKLQQGRVADARGFIADRLEAQIGYLSRSSDTGKWNDGECSKLRRLGSMMGQSASFTRLRERVTSLTDEFCDHAYVE